MKLVREKSTIKRLECLCKKYSKVSQFRNYLSKEYLAIGHHKRAEKVNDRLLEIHPDYLFGKLNKAHQLMEQGEAEKIPELLGETLELQSLYPERPLDLNPPQQGLKLAIVKTIFSGKTLST